MRYTSGRGSSFSVFETSYHLLAEKEQDPDILGIAKELIFIPDYLSHLLGAKKYSEYTIASVSNLYNLVENKWDEDILKAYGLPREIFMPIVYAGDKVGEIAKDVTDELQVPSAEIYAVGSTIRLRRWWQHRRRMMKSSSLFRAARGPLWVQN